LINYFVFLDNKNHFAQLTLVTNSKGKDRGSLAGKMWLNFKRNEHRRKEIKDKTKRKLFVLDREGWNEMENERFYTGGG